MGKQDEPIDFEKQLKASKEGLARLVYDHEFTLDEGFFAHVGLPSSVTWTMFRAYYDDKDGDVDVARLVHDVHSFPPTSERWKRAAEEAGFTPEKFLLDLLEMIAGARAAGDQRALADLEDQLRHFKTELIRKN